MGMVSNVTAANYQQLAGDAIKANSGGFVACCQSVVVHGVLYAETPEQWGAWEEYFTRKRIPMRMSATHWTVPTEWPHQFDDDWTHVSDTLAAKAYVKKARRVETMIAQTAHRMDMVASWREEAADRRKRMAEADKPPTILTMPEAPEWLLHGAAIVHPSDKTRQILFVKRALDYGGFGASKELVDQWKEFEPRLRQAVAERVAEIEAEGANARYEPG